MGHRHEYAATASWRGTTAVGYEHYDRNHEAAAPPAASSLALSGDASFGGDGSLMNPEQLLVVAASSCQLLSFLALAARARIDVVAYDDDAIGVMPEDDKPVRLTRIELRPRITVVNGPSLERVERLVGLAHEECYIANSLKTEVVVVATITFVEGVE